MDNDDIGVGRILSRREALALLGMASAALSAASLAACAPGTAPTAAATATRARAGSTTAALGAKPTASVAAEPTAAANAATMPSCIVRPELTEGPFYVDENLNRSDIRSDPSTGALSEGIPFVLTFNVTQVANGACVPLPGAKVEVWHCDAAGIYSDVNDRGSSTKGQQFLRGYQETDAHGTATFTTIYPGWYAGRTVHIHFKVRPTDKLDFTSQLFFDDTLTDQVFQNEPYAAKGQRNTLNRNDNIFDDQLLLEIAPSGDGYAATFNIGMQLS